MNIVKKGADRPRGSVSNQSMLSSNTCNTWTSTQDLDIHLIVAQLLRDNSRQLLDIHLR